MAQTDAVATTPRFHSILGDALFVGLETTLLKSELPSLRKAFADLQTKRAETGYDKLPELVVRDPNVRGNKPEAKTVSIIHPGGGGGSGIAKQLLTPEDALAGVVMFFDITVGVPVLFQRLNLKQMPSRNVLGLICGRYGETAPFPIRLRTQSANDRIGFANLDFLSKTATWNPIFVKYRINTAMKDLETGYVKIDASKNTVTLPINAREGDPRVDVTMVGLSYYSVPESEVPEFLKTAQTFPE